MFAPAWYLLLAAAIALAAIPFLGSPANDGTTVPARPTDA